jgi:hypothetical protein
VLDTPPVTPHGHGAVIVDLAHPDDAARAKFSRPGPFPLGALLWTSGDARLGVEREAPSFLLHEHVGWLADDADGADPRDVVKQVSFLRASRDVTPDEFRTHYRHHVTVARRHMPTLWQYVQYDVEPEPTDDVPVAPGIDAVSVLWFRTTDDFLHRYFASPDDEREFRSQEGFLDLSGAFTFVVSTQPPSGPAARP